MFLIQQDVLLVCTGVCLRIVLTAINEDGVSVNLDLADLERKVYVGVAELYRH